MKGPPRADVDPEGTAESECGRLDAETGSAGTNVDIAPKCTAGTAGVPDAGAANKEVYCRDSLLRSLSS